jgi:protein-disulfide isomerase
VRFAHETAREVEKEYVAKGLVQIIFVDFALHGEPAVTNAEAAHCAQDQGQFWAYHDLLYQSTSEEGARYSRQQLDGFAKKLNLNMAAFSQCLDSHKYRTFVITSTDEGRLMGFKVVPTLLVNQRIIEGFLPFKDLRPIIEAELNKAP